MRSLRIAVCFCCAALACTAAQAQFGMYGSPEMLQLPQVRTPGVVYAPSGPQYGSAYGQTLAAPPLREPGIAGSSISSQRGGAGEGQNVISQILSEPTLGCAQPACNGCQQSDCAPAVDGCCDGCYSHPWYGSISALVLGRDCANKVWTSYEDHQNANQLTNTEDAKADWRWGGEIRFGRRFCCNQWAIEASYWTVDPMHGSVSTTNSSGVSTPLRTSDVQFNGQSAENWFDGAAEHRLSRRDEIHNVEINFLRNRMFCGCNTPWSVDWLLGVRFFRFEEELTFASLQQGARWIDGANTVFLEDAIANNLWGAQFGFNAEYCLGGNLKVFATPKFGVYDNHIDHLFKLHLGDGTNADTGSSGVIGTYPVASTIDRIAFLTQLDVGLDWQFSERWSARLGYRVMAATGIGLADSQIPPYLVDVAAIRDIDGNGSLILHGAFAGLTYNF